MNFKEKKQAFNSLLDTCYLERDRMMLKHYKADSPAIYIVGSGEKQQKEILWELLDLVSRDEIIRFRETTELSQAVIKETTGKTPLPAKKKASEKRLNTRKLIGNNSKMKIFKKPLSFTMTGLTVLRKCENWMQNLTISQLLKR
nr:hypothetical protein [uncultured Butyricimonas sp.]